MVIVLQNDTTETNLTVCQAHLPYQWNAAMLLTNAGTYQHHFIKSNGCDSFVILHLNISNIASSNTTINICQSNAPYLWNGQSLSASGSYSHTFIMGNSCDSIANLQLTITPLIHPDFTQVQTICSGDNFTLPGVSNNGITGSWSPPINNLITTTYLFTPDPGQCGDTVHMTVQVNQPTTPQFNVVGTYCRGEAFTLPTTSLNGIIGSWSPAINNTQTTLYTFTPSTGQCASVVTMRVTITQPVIPTFSPIGPYCRGEAFTLPAFSLNGISGTWSPAINNTQTTTYTFVPNSGMCAQNKNITVIIRAPVTPSFSFPTQYCLEQNSQTLPSISNNGINGYWTPAIVNTNIPSTAIYIFTSQSGQCANNRSLTIIVDTLISPRFSRLPSSLCKGTVFTLPNVSSNGITGTWTPAINSDTTTLYTFTPDFGQCARTYTRQVVIQTPTVPSFSNIGPYCRGGTFTLPVLSINGITGTWSPAINNQQTTQYLFTPGSGQCADTNHLQVVITQPVIPTFSSVGPFCVGSAFNLPQISNNGIAGSWSPAINNQQTTTYTFTPNLNQCVVYDSVFTQTVQVNTSFINLILQSICTGQSYQLPWGGQVNTTGNYSHLYHTTNGCDSTVTISLQVTPVYKDTILAFTCNGTAYPLPWRTQAANSGYYSHLYQTINGCDSLVTVFLTTYPVYAQTISANTCQGTPYQLPWGRSVLNPGTYSHNYQTINGCDSIVTVNLTINAGTFNVERMTACQSYIWHGTNYNSSGRYLYSYYNANGCASTDTLFLTINTGTHNVDRIVSCESYVWHGTNYNSSGRYLYAYNNANGCASTDTLYLTINTASHNTESRTACESYVWHGTNYSLSGNYVFRYNNTSGCASADTLHLTINRGTHYSENRTVCESYVWHGTNYVTSGIYVFRYNNASGCASADTLHLTINRATHNSESRTECESYVWHGVNYSRSGTYTFQYVNATGCPSVDTIHLAIHHGSHQAETAAACNSFMWHGQQYSSSGIYTYLYNNAVGCPSADTIHLRINLPTSSISTATICANAIPYIWNQQSFSTAGLHTVILSNSNGCDSVARLQLAINPVPAAPAVTPSYNICQFDPSPTIPVTGNYPLIWYTSVAATAGSNMPPVVVTSHPDIYHYYVSQVSNNCESPRSHITVRVNRKPELGNDRNEKVCFGKSINLTTLFPLTGLQCIWIDNNSAVPAPIDVRTDGQYHLMVSNTSGCRDTVNINVSILPEVIAYAGVDGNAVYGESYQLTGSGGTHYLWSPANELDDAASDHPKGYLTHDTKFLLTVSDDFGCTDADSVTIRVFKNADIYIPNAFTPNGDGLNDVFTPISAGIVSIEYFRIFNRFGQLIFESHELQKGWNGCYQGKKQSSGNYIYIIKALDKQGNPVVKKGNVLLLN